MPKKFNWTSVFICDRCGHEEVKKERWFNRRDAMIPVEWLGIPRWREVPHDDETGDDGHALLCPDCWAALRKWMEWVEEYDAHVS